MHIGSIEHTFEQETQIFAPSPNTYKLKLSY
jgi:hypothetical protein